MKTLIHGGHVVDPANRVNGKLNILIENGKIAWVGTGMKDADRKIDATGKIVTPGFIDIHMHEDPVEDGKIAPCIFDMMLRMGVTTAVVTPMRSIMSKMQLSIFPFSTGSSCI